MDVYDGKVKTRLQNKEGAPSERCLHKIDTLHHQLPSRRTG